MIVFDVLYVKQSLFVRITVHICVSGLRIQGDQRQMLTSLPSHLVEVLGSGDGAHNFGDNSGGMHHSLYFGTILVPLLCL
jgi:hypothetical protein